MSARGAGGGAMALEDLQARSGVASEVFHASFTDREACLLAAFELGLERARMKVLAAYDSEPRWLDAIKAALAALLRFLDAEPALGRLLVVYSMSGGERVLRRRLEVLEALAAAIDHGRQEGYAPRLQQPPVIGEGVVGAVLAVLQNRLLRDRHAPVIELFGPLVAIIVLPYLGAGVAHRELTRPAPPERDAAGELREDGPSSVLDADGMRMTYRTMCVLQAIADYPGASNREVADRAGVIDQGQISKLLTRLHARKLIVRAGAGQATRGAPNAWHLTERGEVALRAAAARNLSA
jgi:AcrR family transcriptional regulator